MSTPTGELDRTAEDRDDEPTETPESPDEPETDEEPDEEPNEPEEPVQAQREPLTERQIEQRMRSLDSEANRHVRRVEEILADDVTDFRRCPCCLPFAPGYLFDVPMPRDELDAIIGELAGGANENYATAEDAALCDTCKGLGKVLTGSLVPEHRTKMCAACNGCGYRVLRPTPAPAVTPPPVAAEPPIPETPIMPAPDQDPWGRSKSDPNYGRMPGFEL